MLVPEVAVALIMEDRRSKGDKGKAEAVKILRDSAAYGVAMFPEDGGDWAQAEKSRLSGKSKGKGKATRKKLNPDHVNDFEIGVADKIVMERARKRRMEVEEEMRMEDDLLRQQREEAEARTDNERLGEGEGNAAKKPTDNNLEEVIIVQDEPMEDDNVVRPKRRPRPVPLGRKPSQQSSSSSLNRHGEDTDASETLSASESTSARPKTARRKKSRTPATRSPVISDFETENNNGQCSMDWALPADDIFSNMDPDTMDLCCDSSEKAGSIRSKRGSRVSKSRSVTPSEFGVNHSRTSRSRSRIVKEKEREDDAGDISILDVSTPRALTSKTNRWEDDNGDTPRPRKITSTTSSTSLVSSSNSVWDRLNQRNLEVGEWVLGC